MIQFTVFLIVWWIVLCIRLALIDLSLLEMPRKEQARRVLVSIATDLALLASVLLISRLK